MVQVGSPQIPGYGGLGAPKPGYQDSPFENYPGAIGNGNGNGAAPGPSGAPGTVGGFEIPNNFWGFVMLMMGMKS